MKRLSRIWTSSLAAVALLTPSLGFSQDADLVNHITDVQVEETENTTEIRIVGDVNPTYSVYRLRNPLRLFVDISNSEIEGAPGSIDIENGVVSQVATIEYDDALTSVSRIVIGFDNDAFYDVTNVGNDLVISIDAEDRRPFISAAPANPQEVDELRSELAQAEERLALLEDAAGSAETDAAEILGQQARAQREEVERLGELESQLSGLQNDLQTAGSRLVQLEDERARAMTQIGEFEDSIDAAENQLSERDAAVDSLRQQNTDLERQIAALQASGDDDETLAALLQQQRQQLASLQEREAELQESLQHYALREAELELALERAESARQETASLLTDADDSQRQEFEAWEQTLGQREARFEGRELEIATLEAHIAGRQDDVDRQLAALDNRESELDARETELAQQLQELESLRQEQAPNADNATASVEDVRFESADGVDRIIVDIANGADFASLPWDNGRATLVFSGAELPDQLRRTLDTTAFEGPIDYVSSYTDGDGNVRVVAEFDGAATELIRQSGDQLVWEFTGTTGNVVAAGTTGSTLPNAGPPVTEPVTSTYTSQEAGYTISSTGYTSNQSSRPRMTRNRITIDLRDADIENVLRLIADEGNINIVAGDDVNGSITLRLRSVPLDEALMVILDSQQLGWVQEGSVIRVAPLETLEEEYEREIERLRDQQEFRPSQVRVLPVNYAAAGEMATLVEGLLSSRGSVSVDTRNNVLIATDLPEFLDAAEALIAQLDSQTPQILVEARIVETNDNFRRQLGIQWGGDFIADQALGNATGLLFPSTVGIGGGATDQQTPTAGGSSSPNYAVNLPAPAGTGQGGAIGFTFGSLGGALNLNLRLSAAEDEGTVKIISAPRIMTLDNQTASITSGVSIPVSVVSAAGAQTVFFDASLTLEVTPRVTPDGNIFLDVNVSKNEPDFENTGARGDPSIIRREAQTQLLIRDGDTTVIGGIFQRNTGFSVNSVPFFGRLPIIGALFRNSSQTDVRNELLVFITPRIVNRELSVDAVGRGEDIRPPVEDN